MDVTKEEAPAGLVGTDADSVRELAGLVGTDADAVRELAEQACRAAVDR